MLKKILVFSLFLIAVNLLVADGFIVIPPPHQPITNPQPFPLEVVYHHVSVDIDGQAATTHIDQVFYNPTSSRLEGYYIFPIPKGAVLKDFTMFINGKETPAELLPADKARKIYEDIVRQMKDPALLEYNELGIFKVRIFPIEPHSEKKVTMSYREILNEDNGTMEYLYPLNTEKFSSKPLKDVSVKVEIKSPKKLKNIYCPTHEVDIVRHDEMNAVVSYEETNARPDTDFKLYFDTSSDKFGLSLLTYKNPAEDGYFFLSATPALQFDDAEINAKDITFVLDVSGSMADKKLKQAKQALIYCIENLNKDDRFEVIRFSTEAYGLFKKLSPATRENMDSAEDFVRKLTPVGGTNIEEALTMAIKPESSPDRPHMVIFMTDGKPTIGEKDEDKLIEKIKRTNKNNIRIFTFGIGNEINTHLLDKITELTKATRSYISPEEDIEIKISNFYDKVQSPVLTDVVLSYKDPINVYQEYPQPLPDIFKGSNLTILGRYENHGNSKVTVSGKLKGKEMNYQFPVYFAMN
ncbi:MAG: trypsin, partial [Candidatus Cloacimonadota bacterium]